MATAAELTAANAVLGVDVVGQESDTKLRKKGDGVSTWKQLPYEGSGGAVARMLDPDDLMTVLGASLAAAFGSPDDVGFDLVLLLGQSNMSGRGTPYDTRTDPADTRVFQYGASGTYASVVSQALDPLAMHDTPTGIGPGLPFARWYAASIPTNRRVLLVPAAHGGTPLVSNVTLAWRRGVAGNLYAQALVQIAAALAAAGTNARIVAALWLQGETDGTDGTAGAAYQTDLDALITGLRTDVGVATLPFIIGQMVPEYLDTGTRTPINAVHAATPARVTRTAFARSPIGLSLGDGNHFDAPGQRIVGRAMYDAYRRVVTGVADPVMPAVPATVGTPAGTAGSSSIVTLTWSAATRADGYVVEYKATASGTWLRAGAVTALTLAVTGLTASTSYDFRVTAINATGFGTASGTFTTTTPVLNINIADNFNRADGVLGSTSTGSAPWVTAGTGAVAGILSNQFAYTALGGGAGTSVIDAGAADGHLRITLPVVGAAHHGQGLLGRYVDASNHLLLTCRVNSTTFTWQLSKRVAGTVSTISTLTGFTSTNADAVDWYFNGTTVTVTINGSVAYTGTVTDFATATKFGIYGGTTSSSGTDTRWDDFSFTTT